MRTVVHSKFRPFKIVPKNLTLESTFNRSVVKNLEPFGSKTKISGDQRTLFFNYQMCAHSLSVTL